MLFRRGVVLFQLGLVLLFLSMLAAGWALGRKEYAGSTDITAE